MSDRRAIPALPPTAAVADPHVRAFLEALGGAWAVRNGSGRESERFVRRGEIEEVAGKAVVDVLSRAASIDASALPGDPSDTYRRVAQSVQDLVTSSRAYELLNTPIEPIEPPTLKIKQLQERLDQEIGERIAAIEAEALARGSGITSEQSARIDADGILQTQIDTIAAVGSSDTATILAALQSEQNARVSAVDAEANARNLLAAQMRGSYEGSDAALLSQGLIYSERQARVTAVDAVTNSVNALISRVGDAESAILLEQNTRANEIFATTNTLNAMVSTVGNTTSALSLETTTRAAKDNALAQALNTIWTSIGGATALIQDGALAGVSPAAVTATKWLQVQAAVTDPNTGKVNSASIKQELNAYASKVDDTLNTTWAVRSNVDGVISGVALTATAGAGSPPGEATTHFMVMADRFSLVNPANNGLKPAPFSVDNMGNAVYTGTVYAAAGTFGGALSAATGTFSGSLTADAINAVSTLNLQGNAVTVPMSIAVTGVPTSNYVTGARTTTVTLGTITTSVNGHGRVLGWISPMTQAYIASAMAGDTTSFEWMLGYPNPVGASSWRFRLLRNGSVVVRQITRSFGAGTASWIAGCYFSAFHDIPGPGVSATYTLEIYTASTSALITHTHMIDDLMVILMESKR